MPLPKLTITEKRVALMLLDAARSDANVLTFKYMSTRLHTPLLSVKRAARSLARKGLAEHEAYWTDDGMIGGSGYSLSHKGLVEVRLEEEQLRKDLENVVPRTLQASDSVPEVSHEVLHEASSAPQENVLVDERRLSRWDDNGGLAARDDDWKRWPQYNDGTQPLWPRLRAGFKRLVDRVFPRIQ